MWKYSVAGPLFRDVVHCVVAWSVMSCIPRVVLSQGGFDRGELLKDVAAYHQQFDGYAVRISGVNMGNSLTPVRRDGELHMEMRRTQDPVEATVLLDADNPHRWVLMSNEVQSAAGRGRIGRRLSWDGSWTWEVNYVDGRAKVATKICEPPDYHGLEDSFLMPWMLGLLSFRGHQSVGIDPNTPWLDQVIEKAQTAEWQEDRWVLRYSTSSSSGEGVEIVAEVAIDPKVHLVAYERRVQRASGQVTYQRFDTTYDWRAGFWVPVKADYKVGNLTTGKVEAVREYKYSTIELIPDAVPAHFRVKIDPGVEIRDLCTPEEQARLASRRRIAEQRAEMRARGVTASTYRMQRSSPP